MYWGWWGESLHCLVNIPMHIGTSHLLLLMFIEPRNFVSSLPLIRLIRDLCTCFPETFATRIFVKKITFGRFLLPLSLHVRGPEGQVVSQKLQSESFKCDWTTTTDQCWPKSFACRTDLTFPRDFELSFYPC